MKGKRGAGTSPSERNGGKRRRGPYSVSDTPSNASQREKKKEGKGFFPCIKRRGKGSGNLR